MEWSPGELAVVARGDLVRDGGSKISSAFIDSRAPIVGGLFVPIIAARDGHDFVPDAVAGGARAVLIDRAHEIPALDASVSVVRVADTQRALDDLATAARGRVRGPVVAITGSNGKTTTRAYIQAVLESHYDQVLCTSGNLNNHLGVPLTLLGTPHAPDAMVLELGMSAPGENAHLSKIVSPDVGVITSVGVEHFEFFESVEAIADAEFEVASYIRESGSLIVPCDDALLAKRAPRRACAGLIRVGPCEDANVRIERAWIDEQASPRTQASVLLSGGRAHQVELRAFGLHNARNAAAALGVAEALGIPLEPAIERLAAVEPVGDRGRVFRCGEHLVVADCYNANPSSMGAALSSFVALRGCCDGPLVAVLGDMLEMGDDAPQFHRALGAEVADHGLDALVGVGSEAGHAVSEASARGVNARGFDPADVEAIVAATVEALNVREGGAVLFKASRGIRLERAVEGLRRALEG